MFHSGLSALEVVDMSFVTLIPFLSDSCLQGPSWASTYFFIVSLDLSAPTPLGGPITAALPSGRGFPAISGFSSAVFAARSILDLGDLERLGRLIFEFLSLIIPGTLKYPGSLPWFAFISSSSSFSASILSSSSSTTSYIASLKSSSAMLAALSVFLFLVTCAPII